MSFKSLWLFGSCTLFMLTSTSAQAACADELVVAIRAVLNSVRELAPAAPDAGLPTRSFAVRAAPDHVLLVETDLGPSLWSAPDYARWKNLAPHLASEEAAAALINEIGSKPAFCPPGLLLSLCSDLRKSRAIKIQSVRDNLLREFDLDEDYEVSGRRLEQSRRDHDRGDLIQFPWGRDVRVGPGEMAGHHAIQVVRALVREVLVRHLIVRDGSGNSSSGADLPSRDRLLFAEFPFLYPLLPFALRFPFRTGGEYSVGAASSWISLIGIPIRAANGIQARVSVTVDERSSAFKSVAANIFFDEQQGPDRAEAAQADFQKRLQALADDFRVATERQAAIVVNTSMTHLGEIEVKVQGLSKLDSILFFYFVADRLRP